MGDGMSRNHNVGQKNHCIEGICEFSLVIIEKHGCEEGMG